MATRTSWTCLLLLVLTCCLSVEPASGRAGGGGGFSGGGGGFGGGGSFSGGGGFGGGYGGGGSYSGGSGGEYTSTGDRLSDLVVILLLIGGYLFFTYLREKARQSNPNATVRRGSASMPPGPHPYRTRPHNHRACERTIRSSDPEFTAPEFLQRFARGFVQVQNAWSKQELQGIRHFVSDGIYERFTLQILEQQDGGFRDHMENIRIRSALLAEATTSGAFEVLTVEVNASAVDYRVSIKNGKYISGGRTAEPFTEFWSFIRRKGVRTRLNRRGLIEGNCPNCGAALTLNRAEKCGSCDALLRSGEYDWVLAEITQGCVWQPEDRRSAAVAQRYRERYDPGFSIQHIEDRASVIFWRKAMTDRLGNNKPLLKVATPEFCQTMTQARQSSSSGGKRWYRGECSVGSIELIDMGGVADRDFALVEIHWSSHQHSVDVQGDVQDHGQWRRQKSLFVLIRAEGIQTDIRRVIDSAHCPNCGSPESDLASDACEFCHTVLNDGTHDWVLSECHDRHSEAAKTWLVQARRGRSSEGREAPDAPSYAELLAWSTKIFAADRVFDDAEKEVILHLARKQGMSKSMLVDMIKGVRNGELNVRGPTSAAGSRVWLGMMVDVALLDGYISPDERQLLANLGDHVGLRPEQVDLLIDKRRSERGRDPDALFSYSTEATHSGDTN